MKKTISVILCLVLSLVFLTGCASQNISKARTAYANGDYQTVVELLENLKSSKPDVSDLLSNAKAHLAFDNGDFQQVIDLIGEKEGLSEDLVALLEQAKTALAEEAAAEEARLAKEAKIAEIQEAFDARDYQKVVDLADDDLAADESVAELLKQAKIALDEEAAVEEARLAEKAKIAEIQEAFDAGEFQKVVELAGDGFADNESVAELLEQAQGKLEEATAEEARLTEEAAAEEARLAEEAAAEEARLAEEAAAEEARLSELQEAFDAKDYQKVVDLIGDEDVSDEAVAAMLSTAQAAIADETAAKEARVAAEEKLAEVKNAFDAEDYEKVLELTADEESPDEELAQLVAEAETELAKAAKLAEIKDAYNAKDYAKVVELVDSSEFEFDNEELDAMVADASVQVAYQEGNYAEVVSLLADSDDKASNEIYMDSIRNVARDAILATGDDRYVQLPEDASFLPEFRTKFVDHLPYDGWVFYIFKDEDEARDNQKNCGPCIPVERVPALRTGRQNMPWAYEGSKVTVLAEENNMSFVLYPSLDYRQRAGWVQTRFLVDEFPGNILTIGESNHDEAQATGDVSQTWSMKSFLTSAQNYTVLSETVENCVGFTLDYQIISENTDKWACIFGPRAVYVNDGSEWIRVGTFDYPTQGTVKVIVNLEQPTDITAIGTIPEVGLPNTASFRQTAYDFQVLD